MKKLLILLALLPTYLLANDLPLVKCELMYEKQDANGISLEFERGELITVKAESRDSQTQDYEKYGFKLDAKLSQSCASNGEYCSDFINLKINISRDKSSSTSYFQLDLDREWQRFSAALETGNENAFVNCDYTKTNR